MKKILFYSFKGGAGRTTALSNVAVELAKRGLNVLCIDMDIEGPGLNILFEVEPKAKCLQDFLIEPDNFELSDTLINVGETNNWNLNNGSLYLIPASIGVDKPVTYAEDHAKNLLDELFDFLKDESGLNIDFILMDSPSGYGDMSAISMTMAEHIMLLFKWSKQHLIGTVRISEFFKWLPRDFTLVASNVPDVPEDDLDNAVLALEEAVGEKYGKVKALIHENISLKWEESILTLEDILENQETTDGYKSVADLIMTGLHQEE